MLAGQEVQEGWTDTEDGGKKKDNVTRTCNESKTWWSKSKAMSQHTDKWK